jgi:hypothetical protein
VVLAPTRELSAQIHREADRLAVGRAFRICHLTKSSAGQQSEGKHDLLITTPMRLVHLVRASEIDLTQYVVSSLLFFLCHTRLMLLAQLCCVTVLKCWCWTKPID